MKFIAIIFLHIPSKLYSSVLFISPLNILYMKKKIANNEENRNDN
jgi:hypothetical protein